MSWVTTYDEDRRRGTCSCGCWTSYAVTRTEFEGAARRHLAWHAQRERRAAPRSRRAAERVDWIAQTMADIQALPTAEVDR